MSTHQNRGIGTPDRRGKTRAREIGIKALQGSLSSLIDQLPGDRRVLVTRRGRPVAVLLSVPEARDYLIGHSDALVEARLNARAEHAAGESVAPARAGETRPRGGSPGALKPTDPASERYRVRLSEQGAKRFQALDSQYQARIRAAVRRLVIRATISEGPIESSASIERVAGRDGLVYRLDVGYEFVICDVDHAERTVLVLEIVRRHDLDRELRARPG